jgi:prepilin-type N-terminal cleavage/methylation domain-containing protein
MKRGFTLVEIMFALGIVLLLAGIIWPFTAHYMGRAREATCLQNLNVIGAGLQQYQQDHGNLLPALKPGRQSKDLDVPVMDTELIGYVGNANVFHCPADSEQFRKTGCSYFWNSALNGMEVSKASFMGLQNSPEEIPLASDKESWHPNEVNILYADSSTSTSTKMRYSARHR